MNSCVNFYGKSGAGVFYVVSGVGNHHGPMLPMLENNKHMALNYPLSSLKQSSCILSSLKPAGVSVHPSKEKNEPPN